MQISELTAYLAGLRANNNKAWFEEHRSTYEALRLEFTEVVQQAIDEMAKSDDLLAGVPAKDCLFRINRDTRFSADKSPYKTDFSARVTGAGKDMGRPGYYFHLDADGQLMVGGGMYAPSPQQLDRIRTSIDRQPEKLRSILDEPRLKAGFGDIDGDPLKSAPAGYSSDHPAIDLLKLRRFAIGQHLDIDGSQEMAAIAPVAVENWRLLQPLVEWLRPLA